MVLCASHQIHGSMGRPQVRPRNNTREMQRCDAVLQTGQSGRPPWLSRQSNSPVLLVACPEERSIFSATIPTGGIVRRPWNNSQLAEIIYDCQLLRLFCNHPTGYSQVVPYLVYIAWEWRNFNASWLSPPSCGQKLLEMFFIVISLKYALSYRHILKPTDWMLFK